MDNKQILGLGLIAAAGVGAILLIRNKQSTTNTTSVKPTMQSISLPVVEDREKLYDEVYLALVELFKAMKIDQDRKDKNSGRYELKVANANGIWDGYNVVVAREMPKSLGINQLTNNEYPIENANIIFDFEKSTLDKMSVDEINFYINFLKLVTEYLKTRDIKIYDEFQNDPIKYRQFLKFKEKYDWDNGNKEGLLFEIG